MFQHLIHSVFGYNKGKVLDIINDIELFYSYILKNGQIVDERYLSNVFADDFWSYLKTYSWLSPQRETFLHQGILNLTLFLSYQYLDDKGQHIEKISQKAFRLLSSFSPRIEKTEKLRNIVLEVLIMVEKKKQGTFSIVDNGEIYKFITWTLQNTILNIDSQLIEEKDKNQR